MKMGWGKGAALLRLINVEKSLTGVKQQ